MNLSKIKQIRNYFGLSQEELGEKLLLSKASISIFENEKRKMSPRVIKSICDIYGINKNWLSGDSSDMFSEESKNIILLNDIIEQLDTDDPLLLSIVHKLLLLDIDEIKSLLPIIETYLKKKG